MTVGLEPTVSLRFACSVKFAIGVLLRCRSHDLLLTTLPPRFIRHWRRSAPRPTRCERCALAMWSSLQQNYEAVFKPLKPLISKELAVFLLHGRVFSQGVFRGCSRFYEHGVFRVFRGVFTVRGVHPLCSFIFRFSAASEIKHLFEFFVQGNTQY